MTLPKLIALAILAALGAYGQDQTAPPTLEQLKSLTGAKIAVRTTNKQKFQGRLAQVTPGQVVIESFDSKHSRTQVRVGDIQSIDKLRFRGSRTDLILRKTGNTVGEVPGAAFFYPGVLLMLPAVAWVLTEPPAQESQPARILHKTGRVALAVPAFALFVPGIAMAAVGKALHPGLEGFLF